MNPVNRLACFFVARPYVFMFAGATASKQPSTGNHIDGFLMGTRGNVSFADGPAHQARGARSIVNDMELK